MWILILVKALCHMAILSTPALGPSAPKALGTPLPPWPMSVLPGVSWEQTERADNYHHN